MNEKMDTLVRIVIPVYKGSLTRNERASLKQCVKVLSSYSITLVCHKALDLSAYFAEYSDFKVEFFNLSYFENIRGYNKLLLSREFYHRFRNSKYLLIYQLDAWVFRDELIYWCSKGYDYIGAPWIDINVFNWLKLKIYPKYLYYMHLFFGKGKFLSKVGNGGFSLRKVNTFIINLHIFGFAAKNWKANEDSFYSHFVKTFNPFFKIAPFTTALRFSFDIFPQKAYDLNNNELPLGCHAWEKESSPYEGNVTFWEKLINNDDLS